MNTLHFQYALEVEKCGSITQAAENLYMAQPNLSKAIKELEDTLGIAIFERTPKGVIPTAQGREFLLRARGVLRQIAEMESLSSKTAEDLQSFSLSYPRGSYIAEAVTRFIDSLDKNRAIDAKLKETNSVQTILNVAEGRFRMGVIRYQMSNEPYFLDFLKEKKLRAEEIWTFRRVLVMSEFHPLADKAKIEPDDLKPYLQLIHGDSTVPYLPVNAGDRANPGDKRVFVYERSTQFDLLTRLAEAYMYVSPIPEKTLARNGLLQRACPEPGDAYRDALILPVDAAFSPLERRFLDFLNAVKTEVARNEAE